jgi:hypothetical protein
VVLYGLKHFMLLFSEFRKQPVQQITSYVFFHAENFYWYSVWVVQHVSMILIGLILLEDYHLYCAMQDKGDRISGKRMAVFQDLE